MSIINFNDDVCALTDTGLVRAHNEDSNRVESTDNGELFVVCDGMGGHVGGATASRIGVDSICEYVQQHNCVVPQQFLVDALKYANKHIFDAACSNPELKGMGSTACVALVRGNKVWYAHVGDSRIYYFNAKQNALYRLTKDHSVVQAMVDQGLITEDEAEHHPNKNIIRRSLGIKKELEAEPCQMPLIPCDDDALLICSDGLSGMMSEDDIREVLSTTRDVNEAGKMLMELAKSGGGTDNITVQIVRFSETGNKEAVFDAKNFGISTEGSIEETGKRQKNKSLWKWIAVGAVACLCSVALFMTFMSPKEEKTNPNETNETTTTETPANKPAYMKEVPVGETPKKFYDKDHEAEYYERKGNPDGALLVNKKDSSYIIGKFEPGNKDKNGNTTYAPTPDTKYYNADGKEQ